jgi:hypothetical protein
MGPYEFFWLFVCGCVWGITTPLMSVGSKEYDRIDKCD